MPLWSTSLAACGFAVMAVGCGGVATGSIHDLADAQPDHVLETGDAIAPIVQPDAGPDVGMDVFVAEAGLLACPVVKPADATCGAKRCGNGKIDSCQSCGPCGGDPGGPGGGPGGFDAGTCCTTEKESCDGTDLGGATCASLGFSGGTLHCNSGCGFDVSSCNRCGTDSHVAACRNAPLDAAGATTFAFATAADTICVAWVTSSGGLGSGGGLHVAVLASDFSVMHEEGCLGADAVTAVAIAPTSSGWIVAAQVPQGIVLYPLAADGSMSGAAVEMTGASAPILAPQTSGGPLLVWTASGGGGAHVSLLGLDATVGKSALVFTGVVEPQYGSAAFTGDGFLVALRASAGASVVKVALDGAVGTPHLLGGSTEYPKVAWNGTDARVVYADFSGTAAMKFVRVDSNGAPLSKPVTLGSIPKYYDPAPIVTEGSDTIVLLPGYTGGTDIASHLDVVRVSASGQTVYGPYRLAKAGVVDDLSPYALTSFGSSVVAGWLAGATWESSPSAFPSSIGFARLTP